jgi:Ni/Co efflux regulator RcnB
MKRKISTVLLLIVIAGFMALAIASGDDDEPTRENNDNAQQQENNDDSNDEDDDSDSNNEAEDDEDERYTLNDTATFKNIKVTAEEIIVNDGWKSDEWSIFEPDDGNKFVAVKFTIENISDEDQSISTILLFEAYVDGIKLEYSFGADSGLDGTLEGNVSSGRKLVGYYGVEVSENSEELELEVKSSWLGSGKAVFVFDLTELD